MLIQYYFLFHARAQLYKTLHRWGLRFTDCKLFIIPFFRRLRERDYVKLLPRYKISMAKAICFCVNPWLSWQRVQIHQSSRIRIECLSIIRDEATKLLESSSRSWERCDVAHTCYSEVAAAARERHFLKSYSIYSSVEWTNELRSFAVADVDGKRINDGDTRYLWETFVIHARRMLLV